MRGWAPSVSANFPDLDLGSLHLSAQGIQIPRPAETTEESHCRRRDGLRWRKGDWGEVAWTLKLKMGSGIDSDRVGRI